MINGFLVVDKPSGITSHDVVSILRRTLRQKKIGHTGTLDPFATGVLPIALGEGTKAIPYLDESIKEYKAVMRLGVKTDSLDLTGSVIQERDISHIQPDDVNSVMSLFTGDIKQIPPMFSAVKQGGVPLYKLARKGETVERKERSVYIHSLQIDRISLPEVAFTVRCSKGTYVRTLADDIGDELGVGAHLTQLTRSASGLFHLTDAITIDGLTSNPQLIDIKLVSICKALGQYAEIELTESGFQRLRYGIAPTVNDLSIDGNLLTEHNRVKLLYRGVLQAMCDVLHPESPSVAVKMKLERVFNLLSPLQPQI